MLAPILVTENRDSIGLIGRFRFFESASERGTDAKRGEKVRRYLGDLFTFRRSSLANDGSPEPVDGERAQCGDTVAPFIVIGQGRTVALYPGFRISIKDKHQSAGIGKR